MHHLPAAWGIRPCCQAAALLRTPPLAQRTTPPGPLPSTQLPRTHLQHHRVGRQEATGDFAARPQRRAACHRRRAGRVLLVCAPLLRLMARVQQLAQPRGGGGAAAPRLEGHLHGVSVQPLFKAAAVGWAERGRRQAAWSWRCKSGCHTTV